MKAGIGILEKFLLAEAGLVTPVQGTLPLALAFLKGHQMSINVENIGRVAFGVDFSYLCVILPYMIAFYFDFIQFKG